MIDAWLMANCIQCNLVPKHRPMYSIFHHNISYIEISQIVGSECLLVDEFVCII